MKRAISAVLSLGLAADLDAGRGVVANLPVIVAAVVLAVYAGGYTYRPGIGTVLAGGR